MELKYIEIKEDVNNTYESFCVNAKYSVKDTFYSFCNDYELDGLYDKTEEVALYFHFLLN